MDGNNQILLLISIFLFLLYNIRKIMAHTAHKTDEEKKEFFDPEDVLDKKIGKLATLIL